MIHLLDDVVLFVYHKPNTFPSTPDVVLMPSFVWTVEVPIEMERSAISQLILSVLPMAYFEQGWRGNDELSYVKQSLIWEHMRDELSRMVGSSLTANGNWMDSHIVDCHSFLDQLSGDGSGDDMDDSASSAQQPDATQDCTINHAAAIVTQTAFGLRMGHAPSRSPTQLGRDDLLEESEEPYQTNVVTPASQGEDVVPAGMTGDAQYARLEVPPSPQIANIEERVRAHFPETCVSEVTGDCNKQSAVDYSETLLIDDMDNFYSPNERPALHTSVFPERRVFIRANEEDCP